MRGLKGSKGEKVREADNVQSLCTFKMSYLKISDYTHRSALLIFIYDFMLSGKLDVLLSLIPSDGRERMVSLG